jgi:hypothetical protein
MREMAKICNTRVIYMKNGAGSEHGVCSIKSLPEIKSCFFYLFSYVFGTSTFALRSFDLARGSPRFPDPSPYLRHFDRNVHEKVHIDLMLYK